MTNTEQSIVMKNDFTFSHRQEGFDNHISWSIRGYEHLLSDVISFSRYFIENDTNVVDIGCSTGRLLDQLIQYNKEIIPSARYTGVEIASGFYNDLEKRLKKLSKEDLTIVHDDIRNYTFNNCSFVTSLFTLQFIPKKDRFNVIKNIYNGLNVGGGFVFSEKVDCKSSRIQDMITFSYYDYKRQKFNYKDIMDKEKTLRHMLKPNEWHEIQEMIKSSGFKLVEDFWRNHNFVAAIAIK